MFNKKLKWNNGFTLIELLVVISVISVISTVVLNAVNSVRSKAADIKRIEDLKQLEAAIRLYYSDNGKYPESENGECPGTGDWWERCNPKFYTFSTSGQWQNRLGDDLSEYFSEEIPEDSINNSYYRYMYAYVEPIEDFRTSTYGCNEGVCNECNGSFFIRARLENASMANNICEENENDYQIILGPKDWTN